MKSHTVNKISAVFAMHIAAYATQMVHNGNTMGGNHQPTSQPPAMGGSRHSMGGNSGVMTQLHRANLYENLLVQQGANVYEHILVQQGANIYEHILVQQGANVYEHILVQQGANIYEHLLVQQGANLYEHIQ